MVQRTGLCAVVLLVCGLASAGRALSIAKYGTYSPLLGAGPDAESAPVVSGSSGFTCGDSVSIFHTVQADSGRANFEMILSAHSAAARGAAFSDCLRAVVVDSDSGTVNLEQKMNGEVFAPGSSLSCSVGVGALGKAAKVTVRVDVRLACEGGASPVGELTASVADKVVRFTEVESVHGAAGPFVSLEKTVTTGDGLCGVHDSKLLTDSYVAADMREVKFCYTLVNRGTRPACGLSLLQHLGLDNGNDIPVDLHALSDSCVAGEYDSLPETTTTGRSPSTWSSVSSEHVVRYPCGVTKVEPVAKLLARGSSSPLVSASVAIDTKDSCGGAAARSESGMSRLSLDERSQRQTELPTCPCIIKSKYFFVLQPFGSVDPYGLQVCQLQAAFDGWQCLDTLDIDSLSSAGAYEICYYTAATRYVPIGDTLWNKTVGDFVGCATRDVDIVEPVVLSRLI
eukprot:CAMPEP_0185850408 /NCGR_PEP_ID=MMETSP1354-20130828/4547_1 /TAXON_ID=708628 /ORGANISM="Erythrolobus madagascarensis, Strain CCMP3276" /LENGTH=453 /DNA_ID=CAMNT_0028551077 /DNA_START=51 /DNA_END=1412 /DNA_ORIENTATION=+